MFKLYKKVKSDLYDFTDYCGAITLRSSLDEISEELDIEISAKFLSESDIINLYDDEKNRGTDGEATGSGRETGAAHGGTFP